MSSLRYIFNTPGQYVAFLTGGDLFAPDGTWLGVVRNGNMAYDTDGKYLGILTEDDRLVRHRHGPKPLSIPRPRRPIRPIQPVRPLKRLRMPALPLGYEEVVLGSAGALSSSDLSELNNLLDSKLVAHDGTFLGNVTRNRFDPDSLLNQFGTYGNRYSQYSIFNKYSEYGSDFSALSPFNQYSSTPPSFIKGASKLAYLTRNQFLQPRVDPEKFQTWLAQG